MPRRKTYRRKYSKKSKSGLTLKKVNAKVNKLIKVARPSLEYVDFDVDNADMYTTPTVVTLDYGGNNPGLCFHSIQLKGVITATAANNYNALCRVVIFLDKYNTSTAAPTYLEVYKSTDIMSLRAVDNQDAQSKRFKVLYDKTVSVAYNNSEGITSRNKLVKFYKKWPKALKSDWDNTNSIYNKNGLYMLFLSTQPTTEIDFSYRVRLRYYEMGTD